MERRYESYKAHVIKPFFRDHFARLDRQIVLVDALSALNAGGEALGELEAGLREILLGFRPGANSWLSAVATPADRAYRLRRDQGRSSASHQPQPGSRPFWHGLTGNAISRAEFAGAEVKVMAMAAIRTTP